VEEYSKQVSITSVTTTITTTTSTSSLWRRPCVKSIDIVSLS